MKNIPIITFDEPLSFRNFLEALPKEPGPNFVFRKEMSSPTKLGNGVEITDFLYTAYVPYNDLLGLAILTCSMTTQESYEHDEELGRTFIVLNGECSMHIAEPLGGRV